MKKSYLYRKLNYCYDNFYKVFFGQRDKSSSDYDSDFGDMSDDEDYMKTIKSYDDDHLYEDIDTSNPEWRYKMLDVIQEETDSEYYKSLDYCNTLFKDNNVDKQNRFISLDDIINKSTKSLIPDANQNVDAILENCQDYLDEKPNVAKTNVSDTLYNFKKDFSNYDHVNNAPYYENIDFGRRNKNDLLREKFFQANNLDKNDINNEFNKFKNTNPKIECQSIRNDVTRAGPDVKVSGALNMKLLNNLDKYNRVLTTKETFMETSVASFTKTGLHKQRDDLESFVKRSEKYYTTESKERTTSVELNDKTIITDKTEIRIFYNPTFRATGKKRIKGFCQFCFKRCPRADEKCCNKCICLELELKMIWTDNWLNILVLLSIVLMLLALIVQWLMPDDTVCDSNSIDPKCFEMAH